MKTVAKINPEKEYENAKQIIALASEKALDLDDASSLDKSVDSLITATRVLLEREERRRGQRSSSPPKKSKKGRKKGDERKEVKKLPSKRFPNLDIEEKIVTPDTHPLCPCCSEAMKESGLYNTSEKIEVIPKRYYIERSLRPIFNCPSCHGGMVNTPSSPSIVPTSNYGDSFIIDVSLSKYCDLLPIERYVQIAFRSGFEGMPAQSLIGCTHHLANFLHSVYEKIKREVLLAKILQADETTHNMLEGDEKKNWYLWGFFCSTSCFFETHNTRSGDVAINVLSMSEAEYLVSDGYKGYERAVRVMREEHGREITEVHCNSHAIRYFKEALGHWDDEVTPSIEAYKKIFELESLRKEHQEILSEDEQLALRDQMVPHFEEIKEECETHRDNCMTGSGLEKATTYFLNRYDELIVCTKNIEVPLENNLSEREFRPPVVGRKSWIGTHSKRGAHTAAVLFSIVHSCRLNNINPRNYFPWIVDQIHRGNEILTPFEYARGGPSG